ncbi:hypothetical protein MIND_00817700 [Mycena indigotica]|uniref:Uncharacterized protein n=1 Tax=Mycena indigotica TaxID=2126181 RepID=A0A8H6SGU1_9AGAR|nr:uncharacterized protein MIND_00817700 [Mycena indigotica]KAF7298703.1 hypothetical protein MIND_00817700 [Mycena indigotica]
MRKALAIFSRDKKEKGKEAEKKDEEPQQPEEAAEQPGSEAKPEHRIRDYLEGELVRGKRQVQQMLGLGQKPNVVPPGEPNIKCEPRTVHIGWHPVAGFAGKWFAEKTGLGKLITEKTNKYPDPTQHWAIIVGDYCHQLWMDEHLDVIYNNDKVTDLAEWHTFEIGHTRFNDQALRQAGDMAIFHMRSKQAAYNLITNNCQVFALKLLDAIQIGKHREFATSFAVYKAAIGPGTISELFAIQADELPPQEQEQEAERPPGRVMENAQQVMDENTTQLDHHSTS